MKRPNKNVVSGQDVFIMTMVKSAIIRPSRLVTFSKTSSTFSIVASRSTQSMHLSLISSTVSPTSLSSLKDGKRSASASSPILLAFSLIRFILSVLVIGLSKPDMSSLKEFLAQLYISSASLPRRLSLIAQKASKARRKVPVAPSITTQSLNYPYIYSPEHWYQDIYSGQGTVREECTVILAPKMKPTIINGHLYLLINSITPRIIAPRSNQ